MQPKISLYSLHLSALALALLNTTSAYATDLPVLSGTTPDGVFINSDDKSTLIVSSKANNVLKWKSFNISEDAVVSFDQHNYLNLVTEGSPSIINGTLLSYGNIYIVNPAGITTGLNSSIQAPRLGLLSSKLDDQALLNFSNTGVLELPTKAYGMGRINLIGQINTDNLIVNGGQVVIRSLENIKTVAGDPLHNRNNERLTLRSSIKRIDVGCRQETDPKADYNLTGDALYLHRGETPISTKEELETIQSSGKYFITNDIDLGAMEAPLLSGGSFCGSIDGSYSRISFSQDGSQSFQGLFAKLNDAELNSLFINANLSIPTVNNAKVGAIAAEISNSKLNEIEVQSLLSGDLDKTKSFEFGALAGTFNGTNRLNDVITVLNTSDDLQLSLFDQKNCNSGLLAGNVEGVLTTEGFTYGMFLNAASPYTQNTPQIGKLTGFTTLTTSLNEAWDHAEDHQRSFLQTTSSSKEHTLYTNKHFYDPFFTENFALDSDERSPDYISLASNESFSLNNFVNSCQKPQQKQGLFEFTLTNQGHLSRGFFFINSDLDGTQTESMNGKALVTTVVFNQDPAPSPAPNPNPTDPVPTPTPIKTDPIDTPEPTKTELQYSYGLNELLIKTLDEERQNYDLKLNHKSEELMLRAPRLNHELLAQAESFITQVIAALGISPSNSKTQEVSKA